MLTIEDIARELRLNKMTIFRYLKSGKITGVKIGGSWRFNKEELDRIKKEGI